MKIGIDISPLRSGHSVRGTGFYLTHLKNALLRYFPEHEYTFFREVEALSEQLDVVHYPYFEPFFVTQPVIRKYKTVITVHDLTPIKFSKHFPSGLKGKITWEINKKLIKNSDAIITDSQSSKNDIIQYTGIPDKKIHVVYLAAGEEFKRLENSNHKTAIRKKYNLPEKFALYVGDVTWNKNLPRLIKATEKAGVPFILVGKAVAQENFDKDNPWNKDLVEVKHLLKDAENTRALGFVPTEDLVALYNLATIFVMPSLYEGFGLPIIEAMACGTPVVTTKEGPIPEVAGDAAFFVHASDTDTIVKGIKEVFENNSLQHNLSEKGIKRVQKFSWQKAAAETVAVYEKVITLR